MQGCPSNSSTWLRFEMSFDNTQFFHSVYLVIVVIEDKTVDKLALKSFLIILQIVVNCFKCKAYSTVSHKTHGSVSPTKLKQIDVISCITSTKQLSHLHFLFQGCFQSEKQNFKESSSHV